MPLNFDNVLGIHSRALQLRDQRTQILASNLANAETPGYQARDLDFAKLMQTTKNSSKDNLNNSILYRVPNNPSKDGNTVEVGTEQFLFSQNASDFQMSLTFLNLQIQGLRTAIKGE